MMTKAKRLYVLDTNVLMHDPAAMFKFEEHDVYLPMTVIEELDNGKKGMNEANRNARQASRFLNELIEANPDGAGIMGGIPLRHPDALPLHSVEATGKLYFQTEANDLSQFKARQKPDNEILASVLMLRNKRPDNEPVLVSKDINLRIKANIFGITAEDYENDRALDDFSLLYTGAQPLSADFWHEHRDSLHSWMEQGTTYYSIKRPQHDAWHVNQFLYLPEPDNLEFRVVGFEDDQVILALTDDYTTEKHQVWGISARNREQNCALNALMNPDIDFVTLLGTAGTGKTLLALAAGLTQTLDAKRYSEIIMTRATVSVGEDIGFLPGTEEEKMTPWMGALTDNLEVLTDNQEGGNWGRAATNDLLASRIKIRSMNFMRGRTFLQRYVIVDEAQNLTSKQMKTLLTRAGPGTKMICMGNVEQIDSPYLTETTSGLTYVVDRFKDWPHSAHITLRRGERSRLADFASEVL